MSYLIPLHSTLQLTAADLLDSGCFVTPIRKMRTGSYRGAIRHDGRRRTYRIHIPPSYNGLKPLPLVIALHGRWQRGLDMHRVTRGGLKKLADKKSFILVCPNGIQQHWHDGTENPRLRTHIKIIDDVGFISELIDHLSGHINVNNKRVYVAGLSNGGVMCHRLACELSGKIAAIASVLGPMSEHVHSNHSPSRPVSVLAINSTRDPFVPWQGGKLGVSPVTFGKVLSVRRTVEYWAAHNNCTSSFASIMEPNRDPRDGTRAWREVYSEGNEGTEVILYTIEGGGHTWPGGFKAPFGLVFGKTNYDINATEVIWDFFERHVRE